jgi:hypothetical protein
MKRTSSKRLEMKNQSHHGTARVQLVRVVCENRLDSFFEILSLTLWTVRRSFTTVYMV